MRTCVWCEQPLPEPTHKGHRRREFCSDRCKQRHYMWHKQIRHDVDTLQEPYWKVQYGLLVEQYKFVERLLQERLSDIEKAQRHIDRLEESNKYYIQQYEDLQIDCRARLKALGMSDQDINEFETYWAAHYKEDSQDV